MGSVLLAITLLLVTIAATATVFTRNPRRQVFVFGLYGLTLAILFALLKAPDVALSELGAGAVVLPFVIMATLASTDATLRR